MLLVNVSHLAQTSGCGQRGRVRRLGGQMAPRTRPEGMKQQTIIKCIGIKGSMYELGKK